MGADASDPQEKDRRGADDRNSGGKSVSSHIKGFKTLPTPHIDNELRAAVWNGLWKNREKWVDRGGWFTSGASSYLDGPIKPNERQHSMVFESALHKTLLEPVCQYLARTTGRIKFGFREDAAPPGFHIFDARANGLEASRHIDSPWEKFGWPGPIEDPFSATLPIILPFRRTGLKVWQNLRGLKNPYEIEKRTKSTPFEVITYETGRVYFHDGQTPHQIWVEDRLGPNEWRVTYQFHGVFVPMLDKWVIFF